MYGFTPVLLWNFLVLVFAAWSSVIGKNEAIQFVDL
jgi:hypothetical protein